MNQPQRVEQLMKCVICILISSLFRFLNLMTQANSVENPWTPLSFVQTSCSFIEKPRNKTLLTMISWVSNEIQWLQTKGFLLKCNEHIRYHHIQDKTDTGFPRNKSWTCFLVWEGWNKNLKLKNKNQFDLEETSSKLLANDTWCYPL